MKADRKGLAAGALALALSACATQSGPSTPQPSADPQYSGWVEGQSLGEVGVSVDVDWWRRFDDPVLIDLIEEARANEPGLRQALARVEEARALAAISEAAGGPNVSAGASTARQRQSENAGGPAGAIPGVPLEQDQFTADLSAAWEIDLFGRLARREEAAEARFRATQEDFRAASLALIAQVAVTYFDYRAAQREQALQVRNEALAEETVALTRTRFEAGADSEQALRAALAALESVHADGPAIEARLRSGRAALAVLTGSSPHQADMLDLGPADTPVAAPPVPLGLPSELLRRRPDVRAAEARLSAANADTAAARADRFPAFSLTGDFGGASTSLDDLAAAGSETWSIAAIIDWPIFQAGRLQAAIEAAEARGDGAEAAYGAAVLGAFRDVETALARYVGLVEEARRTERALQEQRQALDLARARFEAGATNLLPLLDAQRETIGLETRLERVLNARATAQVGLYRALGGGWSAQAVHDGAGSAQIASSQRTRNRDAQ